LVKIKSWVPIWSSPQGVKKAGNKRRSIRREVRAAPLIKKKLLNDNTPEPGRRMKENERKGGVGRMTKPHEGVDNCVDKTLGTKHKRKSPGRLFVGKEPEFKKALVRTKKKEPNWELAEPS